MSNPQRRCSSCTTVCRTASNPAVCVACLTDSPEAIEQRRSGMRLHWQAKEKRNRKNLRVTVLQAYGGKCACCGETELCFLVIDHVNENGAEHRRELALAGGRRDRRLYRAIIEAGFPADYQALCHNCNFAKTFVEGGCPHQQKAA